MTAPSETALQRLVDCEMTADERQALLTGIDQTPELWREIALAFIEQQVLSDELSTLFADEQSESITQHAGIAKRRLRRPILWPLAMAASLIGMLSLGFIAGHQIPSPTTTIAQAPIQGASGPSDAPYRLQLSTVSHTGAPQTIEVPVYEQTQFQDISHPKTAALSARGYAIDWKTDFLTSRLQDGRRLIVPVKTPNVHYFGQ